MEGAGFNCMRREAGGAEWCKGFSKPVQMDPAVIRILRLTDFVEQKNN